MDLFEYRAQLDGHVSRPLADRMRPMNLDEFIGQRHAVGEGEKIG